MHSDEFALASIEKILRDQRIRQVAAPVTANEEEILGSDEGAEEQEAASVSATASLLPAQQSQLAQSVGLVLLRLQRFPESLAYFQSALRFEKGPARRKEIAGRITDVRARLRRQQLNAARQPILHADLEQDRLVRPRLVARAAPPTKPTVKPGERP